MLGGGLVQKEILKLMDNFEPWFFLEIELKKNFDQFLFLTIDLEVNR